MLLEGNLSLDKINVKGYFFWVLMTICYCTESKIFAIK